MESKENKKSDVEAKEEFVRILTSRGYKEISISASPADIVCTCPNGTKKYFEIKYTTKSERYFGAATLTEWRCAIENKNDYLFVVAYKKNNEWKFEEYSAEEFLKYSSIPPFKIYFNLDITDREKGHSKKTKKIILNWERLSKMILLYDEFKNEI